MTTRSAPWTLALAVAVAAVTPGAPPARADDPKADPLPDGAKLRLGGPRFGTRAGSPVATLPPEHKTLVTADGADRLRRFDLATAAPLDRAAGKDAGGLAGGQLVLSADGKRYVVHRTGVVTVRDVATGEAVARLERPPGAPTSYFTGAATTALSADGSVLAQGGQDQQGKGDVSVWDVAKREVVFQVGLDLRGPVVPVLSADGKLLATRVAGGYYGGPQPGKPEDNPGLAVRVWDVAGKKELFKGRVTSAGYQGVAAAAFSPDGTVLAASGGDGAIDVWDVKTGEARPPLLGRTGQGVRVAFSPDGKTLAAVAADGSVQRWAVADGKPAGTTEGPAVQPLTIQGLAFAGDDRVVAWGLAGSSPVVWEAPSGKVLTPVPEHTSGIKSLAFAAGGKEVLTAGLDGRLVRWDAATGKVIGPVVLRPSRAAGGPGARLVLNLSPDGTRGVTTGVPPAVLDLATGAEEFALPRGPAAGAGGYTSTTLFADATTVVVSSVSYDAKRSATFAVWDLAARRKLVEMEASAASGYAPSAAVSPSGKRLVTAAYAPPMPGGQPVLTVTGWDLKTGKKVGEVQDLNARPPAFVAVADDTYAVVSSAGGRVRPYDYADGKGEDELVPASDRGDYTSGPVVFAPDGKRFASVGGGDEPGTFAVRVREWPSAAVARTFAGHRAQVTAVVFSPDGKTLATASQDGTVLLWDLEKAGK